MTPRPLILWLVSHRGNDLAIVAAVTVEAATGIVAKSIARPLGNSAVLKVERLGTPRLGALPGIVHAISSQVAGHDEQDLAAYYTALAAAASAVGVSVHAARRSRHPREMLARWAAWSALAVDMSLAAIARAGGFDHTGIYHGVKKFKPLLDAEDRDAVAAYNAARAKLKSQHEEPKDRS